MFGLVARGPVGAGMVIGVCISIIVLAQILIYKRSLKDLQQEKYNSESSGK